MDGPTEKLVIQLEKQAKRWEAEDAHHRADRILLALLGRVLTPAEKRRIRRAWLAVPKWYS